MKNIPFLDQIMGQLLWKICKNATFWSAYFYKQFSWNAPTDVCTIRNIFRLICLKLFINLLFFNISWVPTEVAQIHPDQELLKRNLSKSSRICWIWGGRIFVCCVGVIMTTPDVPYFTWKGLCRLSNACSRSMRRAYVNLRFCSVQFQPLNVGW